MPVRTPTSSKENAARFVEQFNPIFESLSYGCYVTVSNHSEVTIRYRKGWGDARVGSLHFDQGSNAVLAYLVPAHFNAIIKALGDCPEWNIIAYKE